MINKEEQLAEFSKLAEPVLEWLKAGAPHVNDHGFNMGWIYRDGGNNDDFADHSCGTAMCIAGAIVEFNKFKNNERLSKTGLVELLTDEFSSLALGRLFYPSVEGIDTGDLDYFHIKPDVAAVVLEHFMKTGEVTWNEYFDGNDNFKLKEEIGADS